MGAPPKERMRMSKYDIVLANCPIGKCPMGKCPTGKLSTSKMSGYQKKLLLYDIPMRLKMEREEGKQHDIERNFFLRIDRLFVCLYAMTNLK